MARPMCMSDDGHQAVIVATMMATGDAFTLCDECMVAWCAGMLNAMTGVDPTPFLVAISDPATVPAEAQGEGEGARPAEVAQEAAPGPSDPTPEPSVSPAETDAGIPEGVGSEGASPPATEPATVS
jgi:hypothetical protein